MTLAGIKTDYNEPGFRHIIFRPQPVDDLSFVKYFNNTPYGKVGIFWKREKGSFSMQIIIPVGCYATVYVPVNKEQNIFESAKKVTSTNFIKFVGLSEGYKIFNVQSGKYKFEVK